MSAMRRLQIKRSCSLKVDEDMCEYNRKEKQGNQDDALIIYKSNSLQLPCNNEVSTSSKLKLHLQLAYESTPSTAEAHPQEPLASSSITILAR